jgi:PAS domain S-box-containing protein
MEWVYIFMLLLLVFFNLFLIKHLINLKKKNLANKKEINFLVSEIENLNALLDQKSSELKESEQLARLVRQSPNGIMLMDSDGNVLWINKGFTDLYEYNYKEFIAARGANYRKTTFNPKVQERLDSLFATRKPIMYEALNITKSGKSLWTQTALVPILNNNSEIDGMVTIDSNIHTRVTLSDSLIAKLDNIKMQIDNMSIQFDKLINRTSMLFDSINETQDLIRQTDQITKFVKDISDKTKILGINAAIEANTAGAAGRGFRVIANEIVDVSVKTINSVKKIGEILNSLSGNLDQLIKEKTTSEKSIVNHEKLIDTLRSNIDEIEHDVAELKSLN